MNTADRSLALVDFALRRRFHAIELRPSRDVLGSWIADNGANGDLTLRFFDLVHKHVGLSEVAPGHSFWMINDHSPDGLTPAG